MMGLGSTIGAGLFLGTGVGNGEAVKGSQLSGASGLLLRRNSVSGAVEAVEWNAEAVALNEDLHKN